MKTTTRSVVRQITDAYNKKWDKLGSKRLLFVANEGASIFPHMEAFAFSLYCNEKQEIAKAEQVVLAPQDVNIPALIDLVSKGIKADGSGLISKLVKDFPKNSIAAFNLNSILCLKAEKTLSCILSTFFSKMRLFSSQYDLMAMLSASDFDIRKIGFEKTALFIIMPDEKTTINFLISLFIKQLYQSLIDAAQGSRGGALPIRVNFVLDEFANLPDIDEYPFERLPPIQLLKR